MKYILYILFVFSIGKLYSQADIHGPTDTLLFKEFNSLIGSPTVLSYGYSNGTGYFFGTNFLDLDQNPNTPLEPGVQAFAQGFPLDSGKSYYILDVLVRVGIKSKSPSSTGTPLIVSIQYLDDSSSYNINTSSGTQSYTIHSPGSSLGSAAIAWNDMITGVGYNYSVAHFNTPVFVDKDFAVVVDLVDFYLNGDKVGLWCSAHGGASNIYGQENCLWLYPNPMLWIQVNHIYLNVNRAIALFPVVDDGTFGIGDDKFMNGLKLGQSFPNPAKGRVTIEYELQTANDVRIELCDIQGKIVKSFPQGRQVAGKHSFSFDSSQMAPGVYFYTLFSGQKHLTKRLLIGD